jgi:hypothetical protein
VDEVDELLGRPQGIDDDLLDVDDVRDEREVDDEEKDEVPVELALGQGIGWRIGAMMPGLIAGSSRSRSVGCS